MIPPRFSILTPSFNQGRFIGQNIRSVIEQGYPRFEHVVVDGGSTDGTLEVLGAHPHLRWVSGPDGGQADALNRGLAMADGEIIGWINSDDWYLPGALEAVAAAFADPSLLWVVGRLREHDEETGRARLLSSPGVTFERLLSTPDIVRQPAAFYRRELLDRTGPLRADLHMVMDLDLWLRAARISPPLMLERELAVFRLQPGQKTGLGNLWRQKREIGEIQKRWGVPARQRIPRLAMKALLDAGSFLSQGLLRLLRRRPPRPPQRTSSSS